MSDRQPSPEYLKANPWIVRRAFAPREFRYGSLQAAKNSVDKPYLSGRVTVLHERTGETWERRNRFWNKVAEADPAAVKRRGLVAPVHGTAKPLARVAADIDKDAEAPPQPWWTKW